MDAGGITREFDVAIIGGALAGSAAAILLQRQLPAARILIVEKSAAHGRKVGEATVELSAYFLTRVLGLTQHLNHEHLTKQGLRFWFANDRAQTLGEASEIGGRYLVRVPSYQLDRAVLDEEVLRRAAAGGAEVWRPATVARVELQPGGRQTLTVRCGEESRVVKARWVIDASGVAALLARQNGWLKTNAGHPTTSVWARWRGVADWDGPELAARFPAWAASTFGLRGTATNHLMGHGWWAWVIPLQGGDFSIGVVFDQRLVEWPEGGSLGQRLKDFLSRHPVGRELLAHATWIEGDVHWRKNLAYSVTTHAGDGFVLIGDAAGFIDPFYSPGMDWLAFTTWRAAGLIAAQQGGQPAAPLVERHNRDFARSAERWFDAIYRDKYEVMGDFELMRTAFLLDLGSYYLGVAAQPYKLGPGALDEPVFTNAASAIPYRFIRTYNRRLAAMARNRHARGRLGRRNAGERFMFGGFTFSPWSARFVLRAALFWGWLELTEGWRTWFARASNSRTTSAGSSGGATGA